MSKDPNFKISPPPPFFLISKHQSATIPPLALPRPPLLLLLHPLLPHRGINNPVHDPLGHEPQHRVLQRMRPVRHDALPTAPGAREHGPREGPRVGPEQRRRRPRVRDAGHGPDAVRYDLRLLAFERGLPRQRPVQRVRGRLAGRVERHEREPVVRDGADVDDERALLAPTPTSPSPIRASRFRIRLRLPASRMPSLKNR